MKKDIIRRSPVIFDRHPIEEEKRGDFNVVRAYENEGDGPHLVDMSHLTRWDCQDSSIGELKPMGIAVPGQPGQCTLENGVMINRMNNTQVAIWHLTGDQTELPKDRRYTDVTEATAFLAIIGEKTFSIAEKLTALDLVVPDLTNPQRELPFLLQGPFAHVPCQIVVLSNVVKQPSLLLTCSRGYGHDMVTAILESGEAFNLRPAGESAFYKWLEPQEQQ